MNINPSRGGCIRRFESLSVTGNLRSSPLVTRGRLCGTGRLAGLDVELRGLQKYGKTKWRCGVADVVKRLRAVLEAEGVVLGGGNVHKLKELPPGCRAGDNTNAFRGGFRLWEQSTNLQSALPRFREDARKAGEDKMKKRSTKWKQPANHSVAVRHGNLQPIRRHRATKGSL